MDAACANSYIFYNMMHPNDLTLLGFKTILSNYMIGRYTSQGRAAHMAKQVTKDSISISLSKVTYHQISQSFKIFGDDVNIATKNELT